MSLGTYRWSSGYLAELKAIVGQEADRQSLPEFQSSSLPVVPEFGHQPLGASARMDITDIGRDPYQKPQRRMMQLMLTRLARLI